MDTLLRAGLSNAVAATLMALFVTCLSRPLARRPAILHGLWLLVLLKLVTPPFYELPIPWPGPSPTMERIRTEFAFAEPDAGLVARGDALDAMPEIAIVPVSGDIECDETVEASSSAGIPGSIVESLRWMGAVWLVGSVSVLVLSFRRIHRFQRRLAEAREASWLEQEWVDDWARRLSLSRSPDLLWVPGRISPMVWFIGLRPRLIMPEGLWKRLDGQQRSTLLAHELAHLRRGDHYVRLLELLATALFWWHPLVWWMRGPLRDVEEQCCDAWVVWALPDAVRSYAETLLDTLEFLEKSGRPEPLMASGLGKVPHLRRRLTMIMTGSSRRLPGLAGKLGLLAVAGAMLPIGATWAQKADDPKDVSIIVRSDKEGDELLEHTTVPGVLHLTTTAGTENQHSTDSAVVVLSVEGQDKPTTVVESGSINDVVKKLQAHIDELKQGEPSGSAKERIHVLMNALDEIKKAQGATRHVMIRNKAVYQAKANTAEHSPKDTAEIKKLGAEVSKLRKNVETNLKELEAIQAKIRGLGGDPGDVPVVRWRRIVNSPDTYTVVKPVEVHQPHQETHIITKSFELKPEQVEVKAFAIGKPARINIKSAESVEKEVTKPSETTTARFRVRLEPDKEKIRAAEVLDASRLEVLEKRLKALQEEIEGLKKGSAEGAVKK